jgi:DNA polymerase III subunit gamma/tau
MEHVALYRKYRPGSFKEVKGQEHVVKVLDGSIAQGNISHAYLFEGSRGTGKTSVARIFAKAIGCTPNDLYEIDAASNRGIDDIRELRDAVNTLPFESPYKVYIIDEVHMLTKDAFNALLKTLEEPPRHVVFILATTEKDKLPETVISRCQTFTFKKPSREILKEVVVATAKKEGFSIESAAAELVALLGDGSFRDTHGILQKVISSSKDKKVSAEEVETVTGAPRGELVNELVGALAAAESAKALKAISSASKNNIDMKVFVKLILEKLRVVMLLKNAPEMEGELKQGVSAEDFTFLKGLALSKESRISSVTLLELLSADTLVGRAAVPELPLELAVVKLCA